MSKKISDKEIVDLYERGVPVSLIAEKLNTSRGHIYNCMKRHKDPKSFYKKQDEYESRTNRKVWWK